MTTPSPLNNRKHRKATLRRSILSASISALLGVIATSNSADAAISTWDGFSGDPNWTFPGGGANWLPAIPVAGDDLHFSAAPFNAANNNDFAAGTNFNSITFDAGAVVAYTLNGNAITLGAGGITNNNGGAQTVSFAGAGLTLGAAQTWNAAAGDLNVTSTVNTNGFGLTVTGASNTTSSGIISGGGSLTKTGTGTATLSAANNYNGATNVENGVLRLGIADALPVGTIVNINPNTGVAGTNPGDGNGAASLNLNGFDQTVAGLNFTARTTNVGTSNVDLNGGKLTLNGNLNLVDNTASAGNGFGSSINDNVNAASRLDLGGAVRTFTIAGQNVGNSDLLVNAVIQNGGVTVNGTPSTLNGTSAGVVFNRTNTYAGATTVNSGFLTAGAVNALGNGSSALTVRFGAGASNGVVEFGGFSQTVASLSDGGTAGGIIRNTGAAATLTTGNNGGGATSYAGTITGNISLLKTGTDTQTLGGANTYTGATTVENGILRLGLTDALPVGTIVNINPNTGVAGTNPGDGNGAASLDLNGFDQTVAGLNFTARAVAGASNVDLNGGKLTLNGNLNLVDNTTAAGNGFASNINDNGNAASRLDLGGAVRTFNIAGQNLGNQDFLVNAVIQNGGVTVNATPSSTIGNSAGVVFNRTNTYAGATTVNSGFLTAGAVNALGNGSSALTVRFGAGASNGVVEFGGFSQTVASLSDGGTAGGIIRNTGAAATLTTGNNGGGATSYAGTITGNISLVKTGTDTQTLGGANTYTGPTTIAAGTLRAANAAALGTTAGGTTVASGASLRVANGTALGAEPLTLNGNGAGGIGALTQDANGSSSFAGAITLASDATISTNGTGTFTLSGGITKSNTLLTLAGGGTINVNAVGIGGAANFTSDLAVDGVTVNENVANTYAGPTYIRNGGTLNANVANALPTAIARTTVTMDDRGTGASRLNLGAAQAIQSLTGAVASSLVNLNGNSLTIGTSTGTTAFAGSITGAGGSIIKDGASTQILSGANTYTGGTTVNAGTLAAGNAKALGSGNLTLAGGTLRTTGGPLAVDIGSGNILFGAGTYLATIGGTVPGVSHDQLRTTGTANLGGGTLALVALNGFLLAPGEKIVLLSAAGGVAGGSANGTAVADANVTGLAAFANGGLLVPRVNLYTDSVVLEVMQGSFAALAGTLSFTPNQLAVARALDSVAARINSKTGVLQELSYLDTQPLSTLKGNLDLIAPEELTSVFHISKALANIQSTNILRHTQEIRDEAVGGSAGVAAAGGAPVSGGAMSGPSGGRGKKIVPRQEERFSLFLVGSGEFTHVGSTTNASGFSLDSGGVTAGVDYRFTDHFVAGISLGYANTTANLANGGNVDVDGGRIGAYATYFNGGLHFDAAVSGGFNGYRTRRITPNNTAATGSPEGSEVNLLFAAGYDWKFKGLTIGPTASVQYTNMQLNGFTETGGFAPLNIAARNAESLRTALGIHATYDFKVGGAIVRPEVRAAWQHEFGDSSYSLNSSFATLGGTAFTVAGPSIGRDSLLLGAGFSILWNDRFSTFAYYDGEIGRANYDSHGVSVGFRLRF